MQMHGSPASHSTSQDRCGSCSVVPGSLLSLFSSPVFSSGGVLPCRAEAMAAACLALDVMDFHHASIAKQQSAAVSIGLQQRGE